MVEEDLDKWLEFTNRPKQNDLDKEQIDLVCNLHAKYYKHSFKKPCTCNGAIYRRWINDLNKLV
tara:strand:+ start:5121 stop:5312 length:192 start_codon:yes stop_codon:yes gene_type:complete